MVEREKRQSITDAYLQLNRQDTAQDETKYPIANISRGGLRFFSNEVFEIDDRYELKIQLANGSTHTALGRICYCENNACDDRGHYYGVSFLNNYLKIGN